MQEEYRLRMHEVQAELPSERIRLAWKWTILQPPGYSGEIQVKLIPHPAAPVINN